MINKIKLLLNK